MSMDLGEVDQRLIASDRISDLEAALGTERTMHAAWRKRAEEAELALAEVTARNPGTAHE